MSGNLRTPDGYRLWGYGSFAHICFESSGCRFRRAGYCVMCDYGAGRNLTAKQAKDAFTQALQEHGAPIERLLLGSCGSIFDEEEFSREALFAVVDAVAERSIQSIIFETHYTTVSQEHLGRIKKRLPNRRLAVELGFESSNPEVLKNGLHKFMDLSELERVVSLLRDNGYHPILNVFLGAPGLDATGQLEDALSSLRWAYAHGAEEVVVFPANLKPGTALWEMWKQGNYEQPSLWLLAELLSRLNDRELESTSISWFGDRQAQGVDMDILAPVTCERCRERLMRFCLDFMSTFQARKRRGLLEKLFGEVMCECRFHATTKSQEA